jgi:hypothetical protein
VPVGKIFCILSHLRKESNPLVRERYGSEDPDPHQNVMGPQHWFYVSGSGTV